MYRDLVSWMLTGPHQLSLSSSLRHGFILMGNLQHRLFRHWITHPIRLRASLARALPPVAGVRRTTHSRLNPLGP
jgi:hypothetical protein